MLEGRAIRRKTLGDAGAPEISFRGFGAKKFIPVSRMISISRHSSRIYITLSKNDGKKLSNNHMLNCFFVVNGSHFSLISALLGIAACFHPCNNKNSLHLPATAHQ
jgi:hypothetical protein